MRGKVKAEHVKAALSEVKHGDIHRIMPLSEEEFNEMARIVNDKAREPLRMPRPSLLQKAILGWFSIAVLIGLAILTFEDQPAFPAKVEAFVVVGLFLLGCAIKWSFEADQ